MLSKGAQAPLLFYCSTLKIAKEVFQKIIKKTVQLIGGGTYLFEPDLVASD